MKFKKQRGLLSEDSVVRMVTVDNDEPNRKKEVFCKKADIPKSYDEMQVVGIDSTSVSIPVQEERQNTSDHKEGENSEGTQKPARPQKRRKMVGGVEILVTEPPKPMSKKEKKKEKKRKNRERYSIENIEKEVEKWQ